MTPGREAALLAAAAPCAAAIATAAGVLPRTVQLPLWMVLLAAPFWEEMVFRGWLQRCLSERPWRAASLFGFSRATWLTGCCFMMAHLPTQGLRGIVVLLPAMLLGRLYERTGLVLPCVLLHAWFNASWLMAVTVLF